MTAPDPSFTFSVKGEGLTQEPHAQQRLHDGTGIPEGQLKRIFEPMVREPAPEADRNSGGLGLGLYIARQIVLAHCGTIEASSTERRGTTFTIVLPRHSKGARPADPV